MLMEVFEFLCSSFNGLFEGQEWRQAWSSRRPNSRGSPLFTEAGALLQCITARKGRFNFFCSWSWRDFWKYQNSSSSLISIHFLLMAILLSPHSFSRQWTCVPIVNTVLFTHGKSVPEIATTEFKLQKLFHCRSMSSYFWKTDISMSFRKTLEFASSTAWSRERALCCPGEYRSNFQTVNVIFWLCFSSLCLLETNS